MTVKINHSASVKIGNSMSLKELEELIDSIGAPEDAKIRIRSEPGDYQGMPTSYSLEVTW